MSRPAMKRRMLTASIKRAELALAFSSTRTRDVVTSSGQAPNNGWTSPTWAGMRGNTNRLVNDDAIVIVIQDFHTRNGLRNLIDIFLNIECIWIHLQHCTSDQAITFDQCLAIHQHMFSFNEGCCFGTG